VAALGAMAAALTIPEIRCAERGAALHDEDCRCLFFPSLARAE